MYRFFVEKKENNNFILDKSTLLHIKSIRLKPNENFICVYQSKFYICKLNNSIAEIIEELDENHEYEYELILCASIIKIKRFEWLIQKATELGVKDFYPIISKNTNPKYVEIIKNKMDRFKEIAKNAAEQSFRNNIMNIHVPIKFQEAINLEVENKFLAHEVQLIDDSKVSEFYGNLCFYVGPEGGFDQKEIEEAQKHKIKIISLGKRILRAETASIALLSKVKIN